MFLLHAKDLLLLFFYSISNSQLLLLLFVRLPLSLFRVIHSASHKEETIFLFLRILFLSFRRFKKNDKRSRDVHIRGARSDDPLPRCDEISIGECVCLSLISVNFFYVSFNTQLSCQL
jgi:hypothetical protein